MRDHLDELRLRSWIREADAWYPYQDGTLATILPLSRLQELCPLEDGDAMLCGTLPALGAIRPAEAFRAELEDPILRRAITLEYETTPLPVVN